MRKTIWWFAASIFLIVLNIMAISPGLGFRKDHGELDQHFGVPFTYRVVFWHTRPGVDHKAEMERLLEYAPLTIFDETKWEAKRSAFSLTALILNAIGCIMPALVGAWLLVKARR